MIRLALFKLGHGLLSLLIRFYFGVTVEGAHRLPTHGPCLLSANHNSHLDTALVFFLLCQHKHALQVLAARDHFFGNRFIHFLVTSIFHALAVNRKRLSPELLPTADAVMKQNGMLLIYPEGGRGDGMGIREFKPGVGYLAVNLDVPVVPIYISGTARAFPKGAFWPRPVAVQVRVGETLHPHSFMPDESSQNQRSKDFTLLVENTIRELATAMHGPWALVTGASSGAGKAICNELARRGYNLFITARNEQMLQAVAADCRQSYGVKVAVQAGDLASAADRQVLLARVAGEVPNLRMLVNNAGIGALSGAGSADAARHQSLLSLNIDAVVALTDAILPGMLARRAGMILNIGSVYSVVPAPGQAVYSGSKAFIRSWSRALHCELAGTGVSLTLALPGSFASSFHTDMGVSERTSIAKLPASKVAAAVVAATLKRRSTVVPGLINKLFLVLCAVLPLRVSSRAMQLINHLRGLRKHS